MVVPRALLCYFVRDARGHSIGIKSLYKPLDYSQHNYYTVNLSDSRKTGDENPVRKESDKLESLQILDRKR